MCTQALPGKSNEIDWGLTMNDLAVITMGNQPATRHLGFPLVLTHRQRDVLLLLCEGLPNKLISRRLGVADATVKTHVASVLRSLNASTRLEAVILAFRLGLVQTVRPEDQPDARMPAEHLSSGRRSLAFAPVAAA